ncbi:hypothetical protein vseg_009995 [Gypsophila vaccaria]
MCRPCGGGPVSEEDIIDNLKQENNELMCQYVWLASTVAGQMGRLVSRAAFNIQDTVSACLASGRTAFDSLVDDINPENIGLVDQKKAILESEKLHMSEIAGRALNELRKLLRGDQPLWIKSALDYDKGFSKDNSRMESSKDSVVVAMDARFLVDLYLDPDKWVDFFPTVFSKVKTICIVRAGLLENRSDSLQLIHEQMHVLSPLVQQREFYLLRYCQEIESGTWVIVDVSYNFSEGGSHASPTFCWKCPSGCMIEQMPNVLSRVTCVERVEVDDNFLPHFIYENLFKTNLAFGAKRWISTLQRTCERYSFLKESEKLGDELGIGRSRMIMLATKLMKSYCSIFGSSSSSVCQISEQTNNRVWIAFRNTSCPDEPIGTVIQAVSSFGVPASPERVFSYLNDDLMRSQWDVLFYGSQVSKVLQIPTGHHSSNAISILQPKESRDVSGGVDLMIFQESMVSPVESLLVYAPVDSSSMLELASGVVSPTVPILASGFTIMPDGPDKKDAPSTSTSEPRSAGSVITVAFQFLACSSSSAEKQRLRMMVPEAKAFINRVVRVIQNVFA